MPEFTLGWRMRLALETKGLSVQEMADELGYSRSTISRWLNDLDVPRAAIMAQWCLITEVDRTWLESGTHGPTPPDPGKPATDKLTRLTEEKARRSRARSTTHRYGSLVPAFADAA